MKYLKFSVLLKEIQPTSTNNILMEICDCFFIVYLYLYCHLWTNYYYVGAVVVMIIW